MPDLTTIDKINKFKNLLSKTHFIDINKIQ